MEQNIMLLKFINASEGHLGNPLYIEAASISAVFPIDNKDGGGQSTMIYGGPTGISWMVEEGVEQVVKMIGNTTAKACTCK
jgi:hypothetical protein